MVGVGVALGGIGDGVAVAVAGSSGVWLAGRGVSVDEGGADSGSLSAAQPLRRRPARRTTKRIFLLIPPTILLQVDPLGVKLLA